MTLCKLVTGFEKLGINRQNNEGVDKINDKKLLEGFLSKYHQKY